MSEVQREIEAARVCQRLAPFEPPFRNLAELIASRSREAAQREYLCFFDDDAGLERRWRYAEIGDAVARTARLLLDHGVGHGDRVAFLIGNLDHTVVLYLATWSLGACAAPINAAESFERKEFILDNSIARLFFADSISRFGNMTQLSITRR